MATDRDIGYCTNVHAGFGLTRTQEQLEKHACRVRELFEPQGVMKVGLWLSAATAKDLLRGDGPQRFSDWLAERSLLPFTLNGFPQGDFHQPVVKHLVYEPTWMETSRAEYTLELAQILDALLPEGRRGSISTLPIAWAAPALSESQWQAAAANFRRVAETLRRLEADTGRWIQIAIEPEPGCAIQRTEEVVTFFESYLLPGGDEDVVRRYITACHDVCHAAVMFESQQSVFERLASAGVDVGKIQVSAAVAVPLAQMSPGQRVAAIEQLETFAEEKYLHQTTVRGSQGDRFYEDLHLALADHPLPADSESEWRVHFHVPIYLEGFGHLRATQREIKDCLAAVESTMPHISHFEVETYAWGVLPDGLQQPSLADGIADELKWFRGQVEG